MALIGKAVAEAPAVAADRIGVEGSRDFILYPVSYTHLENFRNLLLSFAEDMRVILIIIADRVNLMRQIKETPNIEARTLSLIDI